MYYYEKINLQNNSKNRYCYASDLLDYDIKIRKVEEFFLGFTIVNWESQASSPGLRTALAYPRESNYGKYGAPRCPQIEIGRPGILNKNSLDYLFNLNKYNLSLSTRNCKYMKIDT